jgi:hypothetical protein
VADASARLFARYDNHDAAMSRGLVAVACSELLALLPRDGGKITAARELAMAALEDGDAAKARASVGKVFAALADELDDPAPDDDTDHDAPPGAEEE